MPRFLAPLLLLCLTDLGVAVVDLGSAAQAPKASYQGKPVLVVKEQNNWLAIVGIPLTVQPGTQQVSSGGSTQPFVVGYKKYPEQHITLKNKRQVNPNPADLKRIDVELAVQLKAYRSFSPTCYWTSRSTARCRAGLACVASSTAKSATPTPAWTSPCPPARRSRRRRPAR